MPSRRTIILGSWLGLMALAVTLIQTRLSLDSDMGFFLPPSVGVQQQIVQNEIREGEAARLLIAAISAPTPSQAARLSTALQQRLAHEAAFTLVLNRPEQLDETALHAWFDYRYLLLDTPWDGLHEALQDRLAELRSPLAALTRQTLAEDPSSNYQRWLNSLQQETRLQLQHGVWFDGEGRAMLLLRTQAPAMALDQQAANITLLQQHFSSLEGSAAASLLLGGAPALAVASRDTIRQEARLLSIAASLVVAIILLWAYRSLQLWLLAALPLITAIVIALLAVWLLFGQVHGITVAFGITLVGVALDYPLHLFSHLRSGQSPTQSMARIWPTLRLGVLSTALGYLAMVASGFTGLMQLGIFASSGLLAAALSTRWLLPALLPAQTPLSGTPCWSVPPPPNWPGLVRYGLVGGLLLLSLSWLWLSPKPLWQQDVAALSPIPEALRKQEGGLRNALGLADTGHLLLVQGDTAEQVLQRSESLLLELQAWRQEGWLHDFRMAANWLPSERGQRQRQQELPDEATLRARLGEAQQGLPFREGVFEPFIAAVSQSRHLPPLLPADLEPGFLQARLAPLLFQRDGHWWGQIALVGVHNATALQHAMTTQQDVYYLDLARDTGKMLDGFRQTALYALLAGTLLITMLLWYGLGGLRHAGQVLLPVAASLLMTLALLHLGGQLLSLFHLVALLLVLGIGIDYSLFFSRGGDQTERRATGHALALCAISTLSVFAILSFSQLPVLRAIGSTVALGVPGSFFFAWLLASSAKTKTDN